MRFTIAREKLQEALTSVAPAVPAKTTLPVLANILVEATERLFAVARLDDRVPVPLERVGEQGLDRFLVVDEEDGRRVGHRSVRAGSRSPARLL